MPAKTKELSIEITSITTKTITYIVLSTIVLIFPFFVHSQMITGPLINASLLITSLVINQKTAITLGLFPSSLALAGGLLPLPLAPMVPFIMISNTLYILIFNKISAKNNIQLFLGVFSASLGKFLFLYSVVSYIMPNLLKTKILKKVSLMMSWPQFATAMAGGILALLFYKVYQAKGNN